MSLKIHEQIVALRKQKGVTQSELANVLGVSNQSVSKWESGQCCPDIQLLPVLAKYFGVSIDELMGLEAPQNSSPEELDPKNNSNINDTLLEKATEYLGKHSLISTSVLQRKMNISFLKAKELIETMCEQGYIIEIKPGFYQMVKSRQDYLRVLAKNLVKKDREDILNVVLAIHAAWFLKMQKSDNSTDSAIEAVVGRQWGYSAFSEPDMTTVMRGQSVFYSKNRCLDFNSERIGKICALLKSFSKPQVLTVMASLYELTVHAEDVYVGIDEVSQQSKLTADAVKYCFEEDLLLYLQEQSGKYRIRGEYMATLPILSLLCY